jgi:ribosomal protein S18 acetylase RimI-like enzyme
MPKRQLGSSDLVVSDTHVTVRPAVAADVLALGRLGALLVRTHHELDSARFIPAGPRTERGYASWLGSQLQNPQVIILVAAQNDDVLGYSYSEMEGPDYMSLRGPAGVLHDIVVDPAQRRNGVGRKLLEATLEALAARGAPQVVLWTAALNVGAQGLFAKAGFRPTMIEMTQERANPKT